MADLNEVYGSNNNKKCVQCNGKLIDEVYNGRNVSRCTKCNKSIKYCRMCMLPENNHNVYHRFE